MAERKRYQAFELLVEKVQSGYRIRVLDSPVGEATTSTSISVPDLELPSLIWGQELEELGQRLFEALFDGDVLVCLRRSLDVAEHNGCGLGIRLRLTDTPELARLPWEYLYDVSHRRFFSLSSETPVVRYLALPEAPQPLFVQPPLRVLAIIASPSDQRTLNAGQEWERLFQSLDPLVQRGQVLVERLEPPTLWALLGQLRRKQYHVLHFIGHGAFDEHTQSGVVLFEHLSGEAHRVSGDDLGMLLHDHSSLRLALLNACEGGRGAQADSFGGVAQTLVQQGIPAVIAMQRLISDPAAIELAHEFYGALADGFPVDAALAEGRKAVYILGGGEWGIPVLYMRAPDGHLFDLEGAAAQHETITDTPDPPTTPDQGRPVSRKAELESLIRVSHSIILDYQRMIQVTDRPEARVRGEGLIAEHWGKIKGYLVEYAPLVQNKLPAQIAEIAAYFAEFRPVFQQPTQLDAGSSGVSSLTVMQRQQIEQRIKEAESSWHMVNKLIEAIKADLALELDGQRRVVLKERLDDRERERAQIEAELRRLQAQL